MSFLFHEGDRPLLISFPHNGNAIPSSIAATMTEAGRSSRDTDWFVDELYSLEETATASRLIGLESRYVIDLNRPPDNRSLYPGQNTTGLVPIECFDGSRIYEDAEPGTAEIERRIEAYWRPYHEQLRTELNRLREQHGFAILIEAHSIASQVPRLFDGQLPDFNLGTVNGQSCHESLLRCVSDAIRMHPKYTQVSNGRFIGGFITREYGRPEEHIHALQIELSQATYLDESTGSRHNEKSANVREVFKSIFRAIESWMPQPEI